MKTKKSQDILPRLRYFSANYDILGYKLSRCLAPAGPDPPGPVVTVPQTQARNSDSDPALTRTRT